MEGSLFKMRPIEMRSRTKLRQFKFFPVTDTVVFFAVYFEIYRTLYRTTISCGKIQAARRRVSERKSVEPIVQPSFDRSTKCRTQTSRNRLESSGKGENDKRKKAGVFSCLAACIDVCARRSRRTLKGTRGIWLGGAARSRLASLLRDQAVSCSRAKPCVRAELARGSWLAAVSN